jgi:hypothetical protein
LQRRQYRLSKTLLARRWAQLPANP